MIYNGKIIVNNIKNNKTFSYQVINSINEFKNKECLIVKTLNTDYSILLDQISVLISEKGSELSHLALIARDYSKTIIIMDKIIDKIPKEGKIYISFDNENVQIELD